LEDVDERKSEDEQSQQPRDPASAPQKRHQRRNTPPNDVEETPEAPNEGPEQQLSPLNYEEFVYQQQLIEELIAENSQLKQELQNADTKLRKVESQLTKTKQWIKDLGNIKEDIQTLNLKADQVEEYEKLTTENEILKSKIQDLETRVNTLSRAGEEQRVDDKGRFERIIQTLTDENRLLTEKYRMSQQAMMK
jgi:predicted  nucleic acid-binding Zn-ribbon protein